MSSPGSIKSVVLKYFNSWQEPADFDEMQNCLDDNVVIDMGSHTIEGSKNFIDFLKRGESQWEKVVLLGSCYTNEGASLFYDGVDVNTKIRTRVAEYLIVRNDRIVKIIANICPLGEVKI